MKKKNIVLVVDAGGRGSALVDTYARSSYIDRILAVPGNDLMQDLTDKQVETFLNLKTTDVNEIVKLAKKEKVNLVDVAQDNAVRAGLVNKLQSAGIPAVGPTKNAGRIEWDKGWARRFCKKHNIPQPAFIVCHTTKEGIGFIKKQKRNKKWFIKAAGLAEGKGVLPAENNKEAIKRIKELKKYFPDAAATYLIEEWMMGEEFSTYILSDRRTYKIIGSAQDHKRIFDYDKGPNTGGMGCSSPPLLITKKVFQIIDQKIISKIINAFRKEDIPYTGILYLGGIISEREPYVIEFNARWGDPEAQVILPGLLSDLFEMGIAVAKGTIENINIQTDSKSRVVVAGASKGYPGDYSEVKGERIYGLEEVRRMKGVKLYGAGVKKVGNIYTASGGRLFYVVGEGENVIEAREKAYEAIQLIHVGDPKRANLLHFRTDIGWRDVQRLTAA